MQKQPKDNTIRYLLWVAGLLVCFYGLTKLLSGKFDTFDIYLFMFGMCVLNDFLFGGWWEK